MRSSGIPAFVENVPQSTQADASLCRNVVEESLRVEPANPLMPCVAAEDFEFRGEKISKRQFVYLGIGSSNRDSEHYPDGDRSDVRREHGKHLAVGSGPNYCMGAILARREAIFALRSLLERFPALLS
ncbi:MAG: cytochrome P450 [Candidatus Binatia bacterium]|nr:cytochrome P450 [Candidatus Binatia bacterium]